MKNPKWRHITEFPKSTDDWSSFYPLIALRRQGEQRVRKHIKNAILTHPILVCSPVTNNRYLPPIFLERERVTRKSVRDAKLSMYTAFIFLIAGSLLAYFTVDWPTALSYTLVFSTFFIYMVFDYLSFSNSPDSLEQRWLYYGWSFSRPPVIAGSFVTFMLIIGGAQVVAMRLGASHELIREVLGLAYHRITEHDEWWRVITGPYLHNNIEHWLSNTLIGAGLLLLYGPTLGAGRCLTVLVTTASVSFLAVYFYDTYWPLGSYGIVGFSGGIAGIIGYFFAANLRSPESFPPHYYVVTLFVATSSLLVVSYAMSMTSFIAHLAGFLAGILLGVISYPIDRSFFIEAKSI